MSWRRLRLVGTALVLATGLLVGYQLAASGPNAQCHQYGDSRVSHGQQEADVYCGGNGPGCEECVYEFPGGEIGTCYQNYPFGGCYGSGGTGPYVY